MTGPPPMHGVTKQFRSSSPFRRAIVREVGSNSSIVFDLTTKNTFEAVNSTPTGRLPEIGDVWMLSSEIGHWAFDRLLVPAVRPVSGAQSMTAVLNDRNDINWRPFDNPLTSVAEAPHGAYIGERRFFQTAPDSRWILENNQAVSRHRYRALFELIGITYGAGDGSTTFNVPQAGMASEPVLVSSASYEISTTDYTCTTTLADIPGLSHTFTVPSTSTAFTGTYSARVHLSLNVLATPETANSTSLQIRPYLGGSAYTYPSGLHHGMDWVQPTLPVQDQISTTWSIAFTGTGAKVITPRAAVSATSSTTLITRAGSGMIVEVYYTQATSAGWYICAE